MDEPFGALDPLTRAEMQDMLRELLQKFKKTVLLVTHDLDEALYLAAPTSCWWRRARWWLICRRKSFSLRRFRQCRAYVRAVHRAAR